MLHYPALLDLTTQVYHPLGVGVSFLVGRSETADIAVLDTACSRHHFRIIGREGGYYLEPLSTQNPTSRNGQPVAGPVLLEHGDLLQAGRTPFQFLLRATSSTTATPKPLTVMAGPAPPSDGVLGEALFPLAGVQLIGRAPGRVQIPLPHPQVSRVHASITLQGSTATLTDLHSANGTFVNGQRIRAATVLQPGDQLDIGPYALQFTGTALIPQSRTNNIELTAHGIRRVVKSRETGQPLTLLDDITLVIRPREFVCLLGPSGSGKSTLLKALSGRELADAGTVLVNGRELYAGFEALKQDITVVPQKDVLHEALTVEQALWYTAQLRLPPDTSAAEVEAVLAETIATVGLTARRATGLRHLSGGQVKRASLANEILSQPSLLFLDEVTSGLDEQTDREMMSLFRSLADTGKTVVCITHSLANVERSCHLVVILAQGGKLAFVGKPAEALSYFDIQRLGDVYERLAEQPAEHWQRTFLQCPLWQRYVGARLPAEPAARCPAPTAPAQSLGTRLTLFLRQTGLLTHRYAAIWRSDFLALLAMAGQALLVGALLAILFGELRSLHNPPVHAQRTVNLLFLLAVSSFWFGCNNAAKEIVKERVIYTRERDFNLRVDSYYASKLLLLTLGSWLQTSLLFMVVRICCGPPGPATSELLTLLLLALAGVTVGLAISAIAATEEMAITLIPMAVIPQIILSGAIAPLEGWSKLLAQGAIATYWGKRGLDGCLPEEVAMALPPAGLEQHSTNVALLVLLGHALLGMAVALSLLHWQSRRRTAARP